MKHLKLKVILTAAIALFLMYMVMSSMSNQSKDGNDKDVTGNGLPSFIEGDTE